MFSQTQLRKIHRVLAPVMLLPLLLTLVTGVLYQIAFLTEKSPDYFWLLELHKGVFGPVDLVKIYPFLNALGLLVLVATGFSIWMQIRAARQHHPH
jgi:hypothetical protein